MRRTVLHAASVAICILIASAPSQAAEARQVAVALIEAFNDHDVDAMAELMVEDVEILYVGEDGRAEAGVMGREQLRTSMRGYFAEYEDVRSKSVGVVPGGRFVALREKVTWTRDGEQRSQSSLAVFDVQDGRIVRAWYYPVDDR